MRLKTSFRGFVTSPPFWIGLLLILILFLRKKIFSSLTPSEIISQIQTQITASGYSAQVGSWWAAVSEFETAKFTSTLCTQYNNYFGMKYVGQTANYVDLNGSRWIFPGSLSEAITVQISYMQKKGYPKSFNSFYDFVSFMKSVGYFQEPLQQYYDGAKIYVS